ncbi:MAG: hypothetical protein U0228_14125 [Myxococcaceae bacterium]
MSGGGGQNKQPPKPAAPSGARPAASGTPAAPGSGARPAGQRPPASSTATGGSAFDLAPVGGKPSVPGLPRVPSLASMPQVNVSGSNLPKVSTGGSSQNLPKVGTGASSQNLPMVGAGGVVPRAKSQGDVVIQKQLESSGFDKNDEKQMQAVLGRAKQVELDADEEVELNSEFYDGETPADKVKTKSTWRALKAPVKSKANKRSPRTLWTLIDQFAVAHNPRYQVQSPVADPRAHVFAWDVSLAMDCEIPHYKQGREMTLSQTADWLRFEAHQFGWKRVEAAQAIAAADKGELVFVIAKDPKTRAIAVVRPGGAGDDGQPRVASAGRPIGNDLSVGEAISGPVDFYWHA